MKHNIFILYLAWFVIHFPSYKVSFLRAGKVFFTLLHKAVFPKSTSGTPILNFYFLTFNQLFLWPHQDVWFFNLHLFIYKYLLSDHYMPYITEGSWYILTSKTNKNPTVVVLVKRKIRYPDKISKIHSMLEISAMQKKRIKKNKGEPKNIL